MASKGRGHRVELVEGFEVLIGKGDADNDALTFGVGEPRDFWMHVAGPPGSHVVVRNPEGLDALPRSVLIRAAELAAWHSKARGGIPRRGVRKARSKSTSAACPTSASPAASTAARSCSAGGMW